MSNNDTGCRRHPVVKVGGLETGCTGTVLDELTAHLDPGTLSEQMRGVFSAAQDQIVMLITHRSAGLELVEGLVEVLRRCPR